MNAFLAARCRTRGDADSARLGRPNDLPGLPSWTLARRQRLHRRGTVIFAFTNVGSRAARFSIATAQLAAARSRRLRRFDPFAVDLFARQRTPQHQDRTRALLCGENRPRRVLSELPSPPRLRPLPTAAIIGCGPDLGYPSC